MLFFSNILLWRINCVKCSFGAMSYSAGFGAFKTGYSSIFLNHA